MSPVVNASDDDELICLVMVDDLPPGSTQEVVHAGRVIALFNVGGEIFALDGVCPHQGGPLGKGTLRDKIVTCPWHGWQFDVESGINQITHTICQPRIPLLRVGNRICVRRGDLAEG